MNAVRSFLVGILTGVYRPVAKIALEFWAEANIVLRSKESIDNPGPYKRHHSIYAARLLDVFMNEPQWRTLVVMKSSQSGFTLHVLILICRLLAERMINIIYAIDSKETAKDISKKRLKPLLEDCKATAGDVKESEDEMSNMTYDLPRGALWLVGAHTAAQAASKPAGFVAADELEKMKQPKGETHFWYLLINRIKKSEDGKAVGFSTPTTETGITNVAYKEGSQHQYFVPCPHCRYFQVLTDAGLQYGHCKTARGNYDLRRVLRETFYKCEACGGRIEEDHKLDMMLAGEPRPTNFREEETDGVKVLVPNWAPDEMSAHISDLYSLHSGSTWGRIAVEFIRAQGNPRKMQDWENGRMGRPIKQSVSEVTNKHIHLLKGNYGRKSLPVVPCVACLSIDNQGDHQKWIKYAFTPNGSMFVIDWGKTLALEEAEAIADQPIPLPDGREIFVQRVIIDEGGKGGTSYDVRQFCFPRFPKYFPCKGRGGIQVKNTIHFSKSALSKGGVEQIPVCHFDDDAFKRILYLDRIKKFDPDKARDFDLPRLWLPRDITEELVRELCGEQLQKQLDDNNQTVFVWVPSPPNDWGDGLKMGFVLWNIIGASFQPVK